MLLAGTLYILAALLLSVEATTTDHADSLNTLKFNKAFADMYLDVAKQHLPKGGSPVVKTVRHTLNLGTAVINSEMTAAQDGERRTWTTKHTQEVSRFAASLGGETLHGMGPDKLKANPKIAAPLTVLTGGAIMGTAAGTADPFGKTMETATDVGRGFAKGKQLGGLTAMNRLNDLHGHINAAKKLTPKKRTMAEIEIASRTASDIGNSLFQHGLQNRRNLRRVRGGPAAMAAGSVLMAGGYYLDQNKRELFPSVMEAKRHLFQGDGKENAAPNVKQSPSKSAMAGRKFGQKAQVRKRVSPSKFKMFRFSPSKGPRTRPNE